MSNQMENEIIAIKNNKEIRKWSSFFKNKIQSVQYRGMATVWNEHC